LGRTKTKVIVKEDTVLFNDKEILLEEFKKVKEGACYIVDEDNLVKQISFFSDETNLYYKLVPTGSWPTIKLSSVPMHRHIGVSPKKDTESKIKDVWPVRGIVLDTCCGLGYTAIMASKNAEKVHTFERDENVQRIAHYNPYSQELFDNKKIEIHLESVDLGIKNFSNEYFNRIIHDPPTFKISPELYSDEFYKELYRVMKKGAILYHYAPWPGKLKGNEFYKKIICKLEQVEFKKIEYHESSSGIRALKL
jgi:predicted methyltransferase